MHDFQHQMMREALAAQEQVEPRDDSESMREFASSQELFETV